MTWCLAVWAPARGGVGADVFIFRPHHGADRITDFQLGVRVDWGTGSVVLEGVSVASFTVDDIVFP